MWYDGSETTTCRSDRYIFGVTKRRYDPLLHEGDVMSFGARVWMSSPDRRGFMGVSANYFANSLEDDSHVVVRV